MSKCYRCQVELVPMRSANEEQKREGTHASLEHIIPAFLGGHLTSENLLCQRCNNFYGTTADTALSKEMILTKLLEYKRDRGGTSDGGWTKALTSDTQTEILISKDLSQWKFVKPSYKLNEAGDEVISVLFHNQQEHQARKFLEGLAKKHPKTDISRFQYRKVEKKLDERVDFNSHTIGGKESNQSVARIGVNFHLANGGTVEDLTDILHFINNPDSPNFYCHLYYSSLAPIREPGDMDVSHILYLKGDKRKQLLYCYIELFSTHCYLVMLNSNYQGADILKTYRYDPLIKQEYDNVEMDLTLFRDPYLPLRYYRSYDLDEELHLHLDKMYENIEEKHTKKFTRVVRIMETIASHKKTKV